MTRLLGLPHVVKTGKTPVLDAAEARHLLESIAADTPAGLRDRALMVYSFARVGADLRSDPKGWLFRTLGRGTGCLSERPLAQANAHAMIRRRTAAAGIATQVGNHSFRATGITAYLTHGGTLEQAAALANHASTRTTQLYDRRHGDLTLDEIGKIRI
ncbi:tyrosine-type recombinase/integrase [Thiocapsa roseopersicina]|nr:tyrosine-type recombinase/integrase [Thiocapsa roseopersicina]